MLDSSSDKSTLLSDFGELSDARAEFDAARTAFEDAVASELKRGKVTCNGQRKAGASAADLAGRWSHGTISTEALLAASPSTTPSRGRATRAPRSRRRAASPSRCARRSSCAFERAASWAALDAALQQAARQLPPDELAQLADHTDASEEFADARSFTEATVTAALTAKALDQAGRGRVVARRAERGRAERGDRQARGLPARVRRGRTLAAQAKASSRSASR